MDLNQTFYHIYPLGFCGAPKENDGNVVPRILNVKKWIPHLQKLGITALYFGPVFESDRHGYDTRDYRTIDSRLGTNKDFQVVCDALHKANIKVVLDGVFNHVGRGFFAFQDVLEKKWDSPYKDWFYIDFGQSNNPDGFSYANWEGHGELVKLNLENPEVKQYLFDSIDSWIDQYHIDGLRLDVAYCISQNFLWDLHHHVKAKDESFFLLGEMIHGDYNILLHDGLLDSVTNYECRKGIFSSMNSKNLFEIAHSLNRQFGKEPWCLYTGKTLFSFVDNHDVDRIASVLEDQRDLPLVYALIYTMPGIPCIYYGSEWGCLGKKEHHSDDALRPMFEKPEWNALCDYIAQLSKIKSEHPVLHFGDYSPLTIQNKQFVFVRTSQDNNLLCAINIDEEDYTAHFDLYIPSATNLFTNTTQTIDHQLTIPAKSALLLAY